MRPVKMDGFGYNFKYIHSLELIRSSKVRLSIMKSYTQRVPNKELQKTAEV